MRSYWLRILLGAFAVFAIGMLGITMVRRGRNKVEAVFAGAGPLTIPTPFVPFQLGGDKLGTIDHLVVNREAPKKVSSIELQVKLDDPLVAQGLAGCRLAANVESDSTKPHDINIHVNRLNEKAFFFCAASDSGFEEFGSVVLIPGDITVPLLVPGIARRAAPERPLVGRRRLDGGRDGRTGGVDRGPRAGDWRTPMRSAGQHDAARSRLRTRSWGIRCARKASAARTRCTRRSVGWRTRCEAALASGTMLLVLDNYDSFTYNLVQYAGELGAEPVVYRNDALERGRRASAATRRDHHIARPLHAARSRHQRAAGARRGGGRRAAPGRVPRPPGDRGGVRRRGGAGRAPHARQDHDGGPHRPPPVRRAAVAVRGHALPLAGRGARRRCPAELEITAWSDDRPPGARSWACATGAAGLRRPVPSRVGGDRSRQADPGEFPSPRGPAYGVDPAADPPTTPGLVRGDPSAGEGRVSLARHVTGDARNSCP